MSNDREQTYRISGMDCASCAETVQRGVARLPDVDACTLSFTTAKLRVRGTAQPETVVDRVRELGYDVDFGEDDDDSDASEGGPRRRSFVKYMTSQRETILALIGAILILPGLVFNELLPMLGLKHVLFDLMSVAALATAGLPIARSAWNALRINRDININVLMTIASIGALFIGAYTEAGLVMVLFAIGEALEGYTASQARDAIRRLVEVAPNEATVLRPCIDCEAHRGQDGYEDGPCPFCGVEEVRVPVDDLELGETIVVRPGERIAMDGEIVTGASSINEAPITGESLPVSRSAGETVYASTINGEGVLHVKVTNRPEDNTISRLIRMVEEAQERKAPAQKFVDQFARVYTPAVVVLAILVATVPPLFLGQPFLSTPETQGWLYRALALLVVACPCALVISTPVSLVSAISNAARHGVLVKGGVYLEALSRVRALALDKTGTLTRGQPKVVAVQSVGCENGAGKSCISCDDMLALAGAVEQQSEHPLSHAVVEAAGERELQHRFARASGVTAVAGQGITGSVNGHDVVIGSHRFFDEHFSHAPHSCSQLEAASRAGHTSLLVAADDEYLGFITVADAIRETSAETIAGLQRQGLRHVIMLTGDDKETARMVASEVGVTDVRANLLPEDKVSAIQGLLDKYGAVAMVGDGINDAPALATSTVGIAMGAAGTAQAMETADIALMADDLTRLPFAFKLSRATMRTIRANIGLSLAIKAVFLVIVLLGMGTLWMAVLADMGASLLVTLNGTRLLRNPHPGSG
ncbi:MAG: heavy metal translocating P-type ATPase [Chloroflexota bacterium]